MIKISKALGYLIGMALQGVFFLALVYLAMVILTSLGLMPSHI